VRAAGRHVDGREASASSDALSLRIEQLLRSGHAALSLGNQDGARDPGAVQEGEAEGKEVDKAEDEAGGSEGRDSPSDAHRQHGLCTPPSALPPACSDAAVLESPPLAVAHRARTRAGAARRLVETRPHAGSAFDDGEAWTPSVAKVRCAAASHSASCASSASSSAHVPLHRPAESTQYAALLDQYISQAHGKPMPTPAQHLERRDVSTPKKPARWR